MWHRKIQYLLNKQEVLETLTNVMMQPENGNTAQHRRDLEAYRSEETRLNSSHRIASRMPSSA